MSDTATLAAVLTEDAVGALVRTVVVLVAAAVAGTLAAGVIRRVAARMTGKGGEGAPDSRRDTRTTTIASLLTIIARVVIWTLAVMLVLGELGFDLAPLIAGAGIVGLAIGFGAQSLVSDFVTGLFMIAEDQLGVGDWVDVGEATGVVEHVGLRTTRVRSLDGLLWTVRNGEITRIANANKGWGRAVVDVGVAYGADLRQAQRLVQQAAEETRTDPEQAAKFQGEPEIWGIQELGDDSCTIRLVCKTAPGLQWSAARAMRLRIKEALDAAGVEIPFPQRTVWVRTEPEMLQQAIPVEVGANGA